MCLAYIYFLDAYLRQNQNEATSTERSTIVIKMADAHVADKLGDVLLQNLTKVLDDIEYMLDTNLETYLLNFDHVQQLIQLLHELSISDLESSYLTIEDSKYLNDLLSCFVSLLNNLISKFNTLSSEWNITSCTTPTELNFGKFKFHSGRPKIDIPKQVLEELRGLGFSWNNIASMFKVSRWTIYRRIHEYNLESMQRFTEISDEELDKMTKDYISRHGPTTGEPLLSGYFRSKGFYIQRRRVRSSLNRVDPKNTALRWGALVTRRTYFVPWPNSLWHIDGHHSLIRWQFVIHGCIDGKSRKII